MLSIGGLMTTPVLRRCVLFIPSSRKPPLSARAPFTAKEPSPPSPLGVTPPVSKARSLKLRPSSGNSAISSLFVTSPRALLSVLSSVGASVTVMSLLPSLVDEKDLPNAIALNSIQFNLARVLGPLLFAATLATFLKSGYNEPQAMNAAFFLNALSFLIVIGTLMSLHVKHVRPTHTRRMREELQGGLHYVRNHGSLVALI